MLVVMNGLMIEFVGSIDTLRIILVVGITRIAHIIRIVTTE